MSAFSNGKKSSFGGFFKSLFGGHAENGNGQSAVTSAVTAVPAAPRPAPAPVPRNFPATGKGNGNGNTDVFSRRPANGQNGHNGNGNHDHGTGSFIQISLQSVIYVMPPDLRSRVRQAVPDSLMITISLEKVLPQLAQGAVKVPFGDIRKSLPHIFAPAPDADAQPVSLPLGEILPQVRPSMLHRRPAQKHTEVSQEIVGPFGAGAQGVSISSDKPAPAPRPLPHPAPRTPGARPAMPLQSAPAPFQRAQPAQTTFTQRHSIQAVPGPSLAPSAPIPMAPAMPVSRQPAVPPPAPAPAPTLASPISPITPVPHPIRVATPAETTPPLLVPLASLIGAWPEVIRQEVARVNIVEAQVAIPASLVESGLKRGRVAFPWKTLRSWIRPALPPFASANDSTEVAVPLSVVAPLFMGRRNNGAGTQQKVAVDESIPNLFFGFPQPEAPAPVVAPEPVFQAAPEPVAVVPEVAVPEAVPTKPADTNYYNWEDAQEAEVVSRPVIQTDFKSRHATPQEIVARAASLEGVAGALIALPDGLKVAGQIPADLNGDTLAAFLPQLFNKMSQCTRELRMGELNNLNFTVGNVPWKIFRVNAVFFAAFGRKGEPLPTAQLASLAGLLDRRNK